MMVALIGRNPLLHHGRQTLPARLLPNQPDGLEGRQQQADDKTGADRSDPPSPPPTRASAPKTEWPICDDIPSSPPPDQSVCSGGFCPRFHSGDVTFPSVRFLCFDSYLHPFSRVTATFDNVWFPPPYKSSHGNNLYDSIRVIQARNCHSCGLLRAMIRWPKENT